MDSLVDPFTNKQAVFAVPPEILETSDGKVIKLSLGYPLQGWERAWQKVIGEPYRVACSTTIRSHQVQPQLKPHASIRNIIVVGSGKGGVGKSTTATHLALALHRLGARVGMLDADIYGPSQPTLLGVSGKPAMHPDKKFIPPIGHGIPVMSIGFLVDPHTPMIWRGPMASGALLQLLNDSLWGELDYLIVDLPPGTGDIQLTLAQKIPVAGAVVVTTPQTLAVLDAIKAVEMFQKVSVPVLGVIENMAQSACPHCHGSLDVFGEGGGALIAERYDLPLLGRIPLDATLCAESDAGRPLLVTHPEHALSQEYMTMALRMSAFLAERPRYLRIA